VENFWLANRSLTGHGPCVRHQHHVCLIMSRQNAASCKIRSLCTDLVLKQCHNFCNFRIEMLFRQCCFNTCDCGIQSLSHCISCHCLHVALCLNFINNVTKYCITVNNRLVWYFVTQDRASVFMESVKNALKQMMESQNTDLSSHTDQVLYIAL